MTDVSKYEISDTAPFTPKNLAGDGDLLGDDGKPVVFELYGPGSKEGARALQKYQIGAQLRSMKTIRGEKLNRDDYTAAENDLAQKLCEVTKSISANFTIPAKDLYGNRKLGWIWRQVDAWQGDDKNFAPGLSEQSSSQ